MKYLGLILMLFVLGGCAGDISQIANNSTVSVSNALSGYSSNQEAIGILAEEFKKDNAFTPSEAKKLIRAENALLSEIEFMRNISSLGGTVPYFQYIASYSRIKDNIRIMSGLLDEAIGMYDRKTRVIYTMTRQNIDNIFTAMALAITAAENDINKQSADVLVGQLQRLYGSVQPLISAAGVVL